MLLTSCVSDCNTDLVRERLKSVSAFSCEVCAAFSTTGLATSLSLIEVVLKMQNSQASNWTFAHCVGHLVYMVFVNR